jgi:hypothetical protein
MERPGNPHGELHEGPFDENALIFLALCLAPRCRGGLKTFILSGRIEQPAPRGEYSSAIAAYGALPEFR